MWPSPFRFKIFGTLFVDSAIQKKSCPHFFFVNVNRRLTMCGGDTSNLLKASASSADDGCAEYAVCMKVIRYAKLWKVTWAIYNLESVPNYHVCIFHDLGAFFPSKVKYHKWIILVQNLIGPFVDKGDKHSLFIFQGVRVRPPCISVDMTSYSDRLHFSTSGEFLDGGLWDRFWFGAA